MVSDVSCGGGLSYFVVLAGYWIEGYPYSASGLSVDHTGSPDIRLTMDGFECGAFFAPITIVHPAMGGEIITVAFVVVVIGGLGSFWGVVLAALLVGVVRGITIHFVPAAGEASIYVLMFAVLMLRPRGLLGERIEKFE